MAPLGRVSVRKLVGRELQRRVSTGQRHWCLRVARSLDRADASPRPASGSKTSPQSSTPILTLTTPPGTRRATTSRPRTCTGCSSPGGRGDRAGVGAPDRRAAVGGRRRGPRASHRRDRARIVDRALAAAGGLAARGARERAVSGAAARRRQRVGSERASRRPGVERRVGARGAALVRASPGRRQRDAEPARKRVLAGGDRRPYAQSPSPPPVDRPQLRGAVGGGRAQLQLGVARAPRQADRPAGEAGGRAGGARRTRCHAAGGGAPQQRRSDDAAGAVARDRGERAAARMGCRDPARLALRRGARSPSEPTVRRSIGGVLASTMPSAHG